MDLMQFQSFQAIARIGNLTKAAESMHISQPAMSSSLSRLETELSVRLFDRQGRKLVLNEQGRIFLEYVDMVLAGYDKTLKKLSPEPIQSNRLTIYVVDDSGIPALLREFKKTHPDCLFRQIDIEKKNVERALQEDDCDFVGVSYRDIPDFSANFISLGKNRLALAVPKNNHLFDRKSVRISELKDECFVTLPSDSSVLSTPEKICSEAGFKRKIVAECYQGQLVNTILGTDYISFVGEYDIETTSPFLSEHIRFIPFEPELYIDSLLLWKKDKPLSSLAAEFLSMAQNKSVK